MKILIINWTDSCGEDGPFDKEETPELMTMISAGILVRQNPEQITICQDFWSEQYGYRYRDVIVIPRKSIIMTKEYKITYKFMENMDD